MKSRPVTLAGVARASVALLASCALWLVVGGDERSALWVPVSVELSGSGVVASGDAPASPTVRALMTGRRRDFIRMLHTPPVLRRALTDMSADSSRVDFGPTDVRLPSGSEARVTDLQPRMLFVRRSSSTRGPRA